MIAALSQTFIRVQKAFPVFHADRVIIQYGRLLIISTAIFLNLLYIYFRLN